MYIIYTCILMKIINYLEFLLAVDCIHHEDKTQIYLECQITVYATRIVLFKHCRRKNT